MTSSSNGIGPPRMDDGAAAGRTSPVDRWEMGSEFHWNARDLLPGAEERDWLPRPSVCFSTGTGALRALLPMLPGRPAIHFPSFFCMGVAESLAGAAEVRWYRELPDGAGPDLATIRARPGDVVLVVNLFGRGSRAPWAAWAHGADRPLVVEDHTHDPHSTWAKESVADYCIASLRKTLPVPDGAVLWSPTGRDLPRPRPGCNRAATAKLTAMTRKAAWLRGDDVSRQSFRKLQTVAEEVITEGAAPATEFTRRALRRLDVRRLRAARGRNVDRLLDGLRSRPLPDITEVGHGASGAVPFHVQLVCRTAGRRTQLRAHLAAHRIFAPVHWPQPCRGWSSGDEAAMDLSSRMLTVPLDHRYGERDVDRVLGVLRSLDP